MSPYILLVDPSQTDEQIIRGAFINNQFSCTLYRVNDGAQALDYVQHQGRYMNQTEFPLPDIILSEVNLPKVDGHSLVRELRSIDEVSKIPLIMFTNRKTLKNVFKFEGVDDYILKSLDPDVLVEKIREILAFKDEFFGDE